MKLERLNLSKFSKIESEEMNVLVGGAAATVMTATICTQQSDSSDTGHADAPTEDEDLNVANPLKG